MDFNLSNQQIEAVQQAQEFAKKEITPYIKKIEDDFVFRKQLFIKMAVQGFFKPYTDFLSYLLVLKEIAKADGGLAVAFSVTHMVLSAIAHFGTEEQKKNYLPRVESGELVPLAFALTEKETGSDAKHIQLKADASGILNGEKHYISNADLAGCIIVLAQSPQGMTAYLVDRGAAGLSFPKKEKKLGLLSANLVSVRFDNCQGQILGQPGEGFKIAMNSLDSGRIGIAAQSMGIAEAAYEASLVFSKQRRQFGHPIFDYQAIAFKLSDMLVKLDAGLLLMYKAAWLKQHNKPCTLEASEAKLFCSEAVNQIAYDAVQIFGVRGYVEDYPIEKYFRDARATTLYEGTSEIQRVIISRKM